MKSSDIPEKFPIPFANSAGSGFITYPIPEASQIGVTDGAASLTDGFPPDNFLPVGSGGTPPFGKDFNGLLKQTTQWSQWQNAGGTVIYDSQFATDIGGYPKGAFLGSANNPGIFWVSTVDDNTTNPDAGGSGWIPFAGGSSFAIIVDQKATDTAGGEFDSGAWRTRTLNTVLSDPNGLTSNGAITLSSNTVTLVAGTYEVEASAPAATVDSHKIRFQNTTDGTTDIWGSTENASTTQTVDAPDVIQTRSCLSGTVTISGTKAYQLQHACKTSSSLGGNPTYGFGVPSQFGLGASGGPETYSILKITKLS